MTQPTRAEIISWLRDEDKKAQYHSDVRPVMLKALLDYFATEPTEAAKAQGMRSAEEWERLFMQGTEQWPIKKMIEDIQQDALQSRQQLELKPFTNWELEIGGKKYSVGSSFVIIQNAINALNNPVQDAMPLTVKGEVQADDAGKTGSAHLPTGASQQQDKDPSEASNAQSELLRETLIEARNCIIGGGGGGIVDTVWYSDIETLVDFIDAALARSTPTIQAQSSDKSVESCGCESANCNGDAYICKSCRDAVRKSSGGDWAIVREPIDAALRQLAANEYAADKCRAALAALERLQKRTKASAQSSDAQVLVEGFYWNGKEVPIDGYKFVNCRFENCTLKTTIPPADKQEPRRQAFNQAADYVADNMPMHKDLERHVRAIREMAQE